MTCASLGRRYRSLMFHRLFATAAVAAACLMAALAAAPANAYVVQAKGLGQLQWPDHAQPATNGITYGDDGNFWIAEESGGTIARMNPAGEVINRYPVGAGPTTVTTGPGGLIWVAVTGAGKLTWFDATAPEPSAHDVAVPIGNPPSCGPAGIVAGGDGFMYFSTPSLDGVCDGGESSLGRVLADGSGPASPIAGGPGQVFDLALMRGYIFAPDSAGNVVRRITTGADPAVNATYALPDGSAPRGIAAEPSGNLWVAMWGTGKLATFAATQDSGPIEPFAPKGGALTNALGVVAGLDGKIYAAGRSSGNLVSIVPTALAPAFFPLEHTQPLRLTRGPGSEIWASDGANAQVLRFINGAPRVTTGDAAVTATDRATGTATIDPHGNATTVVFEYGKSDYGRASSPVFLPIGVVPVAATASLTGLEPATTYKVRARATSLEGTTYGQGTTFTTKALTVPAPALGVLATKAGFAVTIKGSATLVRSLKVKGLTGGETLTLSCAGKSCKFKTKSYKQLKAGAVTYSTKPFGKNVKLKAGTLVTVRVTKEGSVGNVFTFKTRSGKKPISTRGCLQPGAIKATLCA
jgi:streptogramin lyase